jgi:carboxymethylenebutenolidase
MDAYLACAAGPEPRPAVLVVGDIYGGRAPFYERLAALLAAAGFDAVVPEFFFREGPLPEQTFEAAAARKGALDEQRTLVDLDATIEWLRARPQFAGQRVGTLGFCLGGSFVLDLAARRGDLATVCFYGFPTGPPGPPNARGMPRPLDEVDRMRGPILGFWGDRDERVGPSNVAALAAALAERGVDFEHTMYEGLDHGFLAAGFEPGASGHAQAREAWAHTLAFFAARL